jgi:asparagine synthase (glutamine-hydrolysing)
MCGIAGIVDYRSQPSLELLGRMTNAIRHRGPDGNGCYHDGPVALGHARLAIIDLVTGDQPMWSEDRSTAVVFNGEIYNYRILRKALEARGHTFRTQSDTEVILRAYDEYGEDCVRHLRGMFAIALWDRRTQSLFLARDRVGIKPLYYAWDGRRFLFGSEIKALLESPDLDRTIDPLALDDYLTYLYVPAPKTIYASVRKLPPAHTMRVDRNGLHLREYWDLSFEPRRDWTEDRAAEAVAASLRDSVDCHLISDVPLGAFLSGGIDSSAVVATMAGLVAHPVQTASIGFEEAAFDELPYAREVARLFHTQSHERVVAAHAARILDDLAWHYDEPFADSSMIPTYYVSGVARERVTVALSGDGGDENFAGYRRYKFDVFENRIRSLLPRGFRRPVFGTLGRVYPKADWLPRVFRGKTLLTNLSLDHERAYGHTMSWFTPAMKRALYRPEALAPIRDYDAHSVLQTWFDRTKGWDPLSRIQYVDIKTYLVDDILTKVDRASMAHSLEVRVPLLDHEFMELAASMPASYKLRNGEGKHIFKRALAPILPREIMDRPKMGFAIPLADWFRGELKPVFESAVFAPDAFVAERFRPEEIRRMWALHQRGARDFAPFLWGILMLEHWGRRFLRRAP